LKILLASLLAFTATAFAQQPTMADLEDAFFKQLDTDQDGKISSEEFLQPTRAQFDYMDSNGDGNVDRSELRAFNDDMQKRMREMQQRGPQGMPNR
jgi:Ca2+-binding EF-hand superfamily protein